MAAIGSRIEAFSALRYSGFRLYWFGHLSAVSGYQIVILAQGWLIWTLTGSEFLLGALGLSNAVPAVLLTLFGGAVADKVELRRLLIVLQLVSAFALLTLATLTTTGLVQIWHIFAVAFVFGVVHAFDQPGRQALFPHLLDRRDLMNAVSLNSTIWPGTRIFGPAFAGIIIDKVGAAANSPLIGAAAAFYIASLGFALFGLLLFLLKVPPLERSGGRNVLREIWDGLNFVWKNGLFAFLIGMNFMIIFFVRSHATILPVFASEVFKGDASILGSLYAAGGIGSLAGALIAANLGYFRRRGWLILGGAGVQAILVMLFALSRSYNLSLLLLLLAGIAFSFFMVSAQTTVQSMVPDGFRGRLMAIWGMNYGVIFPLGQMQMGAVAGLSRNHLSDLLGGYAGAPSAVILGATIMLVFVFLGAASNPTIRNLRPQVLEAQRQSTGF
jgi:MFS family permease